MEPRTALAITVVIVNTVVCIIPAHADLSPRKVNEMRDKSPEVFVVEVTKVAKGDAINREEFEVTYDANVVKVVRSASGVKAGDKVVIQSYIRNPDLKVEPQPGARPPSLLPEGWVGTAYLSGTDKPKTLKIAVFGYSFVPTPTFWAWDEVWNQKTAYQLQPDGERLLAALLAKKPDSEANAAAGLLPSGMIVLGETKYAIEDDEVVLLGKNNTKVWRHRGIKKELIEKSKPVKGDAPSDGTDKNVATDPCFHVDRDARGNIVEATFLGPDALRRHSADGTLQVQDFATWSQLQDSTWLRSITIPWVAKIESSDIDQIRGLSALSELRIGTAAISSEFVECQKLTSALCELRSLERIELCKRDLSDDELAFVPNLPKLTEFEFNADNYSAPDHGPFITDRCVIHLARSTSLRSISIHEARHLSSNFVAMLTSGLPSLERLELSGYDSIDDDGIHALAKHARLRELALPDLRLSDERLRAFRNHVSLETLQVDGRDLSESTVLEVLSKLPHLKHFRVSSHNSDLQKIVDRELKQE